MLQFHGKRSSFCTLESGYKIHRYQKRKRTTKLKILNHTNFDSGSFSIKVCFFSRASYYVPLLDKKMEAFSAHAGDIISPKPSTRTFTTLTHSWFQKVYCYEKALFMDMLLILLPQLCSQINKCIIIHPQWISEFFIHRENTAEVFMLLLFLL